MLQLVGGEERCGSLIEGVSTVMEGDGGEVNWTQLAKTGPGGLCSKSLNATQAESKKMS